MDDILPILKEVFAMLAKILGKVSFVYYALPLRECAPDQSAIFVGVVVGFLNVCINTLLCLGPSPAEAGQFN
jgi:hypothetical protein